MDVFTQYQWGSEDEPCYSPWDWARPHYKLQEFLSIDYSQPGITHANLLGGWGGAKTYGGIFLAIMTMNDFLPGKTGMFTEPTNRKLDDIFLPLWYEIVPGELFHHHQTKNIITWLPTDAKMYLRSRNVDNPRKSEDILAGISVLYWAINDEMGEKCNRKTYRQIDARLRKAPKPGGSDYRFNVTTSTPTLGDYEEIINRPDHINVTSTSWDNPYLADGWADDMAENMTEREIEMLLRGQFVAQTGMMWPRWSSEQWPAGNIHPHEHDYSRPYVLTLDLGVATSAWVLLQSVEPICPNTGRLLWDYDPVWVATAEYLPMRDGSVEKILPEIVRDYGEPYLVTGGHDLASRGNTFSKSAKYFIRDYMDEIDIKPIPQWLVTELDIHMSRLSFGICNTDRNGQVRREFCVSANMRTTPSRREHNRGILEMVKRDQWPDDNKILKDVWKAVHTPLSHVRSALMSFAVAHAWPPSFEYKKRHAA